MDDVYMSNDALYASLLECEGVLVTMKEDPAIVLK